MTNKPKIKLFQIIIKILFSIAIYTVAGVASIYIIRLLPSVRMLPPDNAYLDQNDVAGTNVVEPRNLHFVHAVSRNNLSVVDRCKIPVVLAFTIFRRIIPPFDRFVQNNFRRVFGDNGYRVGDVPIEDYSVPTLGDPADYARETNLAHLKTAYNVRCTLSFIVYIIIFLIALVAVTTAANTIIRLAGQSTRNTVDIVTNVKQAFKQKRKPQKKTPKKKLKQSIKKNEEWIQ